MIVFFGVQMMFNRHFVEFIGFAFLDCNRVLRTFAETGAKTVAVLLFDESGFAVYNLQRTFGAGWNTDAAAVTFLLVNFNYLSGRFCCHWLPPYFPG